MNSFRVLLSLLVLTLTLSSSARAVDKDYVKEGVVDILSSYKDCNTFGTGFYVADNLVVTAAHVMYSPCGDYEAFLVDIKSGKFAMGLPYMMNKQKDYGLIILSGSSSMKNKSRLNRFSSKYAVGDNVYIPVIDPSTLSIEIRESVVQLRVQPVTLVDQLLGFHLDTIQIKGALPQGASGSPVFNDKGEIIGIVVACDNSSTFVKPIKHILKTLLQDKVPVKTVAYHYPRKRCKLDTANTEG